MFDIKCICAALSTGNQRFNTDEIGDYILQNGVEIQVVSLYSQGEYVRSHCLCHCKTKQYCI